jgi:pilus assembly protein CpaE
MVRIVVADPDSKERNRLRQHLAEVPHQEVVGLARDGQEAVQLTLQNKPDVVLLASRMPVLDGYQAAEMISLASPGTVMAIMSESESAGDLRRALRAGVREFMPRPVPPDQLAPKIEGMLRIEQLRQTPEFINTTDPSRIPMTITITGAKGGVGKTTITTNLAVALAQENPGNVALVDLYSQFGDVATMLNLSPRRTMADMTPLVDELDQQLVEDHMEAHASGLRVLLGSVDPKPLDFFSTKFLESVMGILKRSYRFIVVDVPPILHPGTIYMVAHSQSVVLVANLYDLTTASDTKKLLDAIKGKYVPDERLRVVLNRVSKENQLQVNDIAKAFNHPIAATIPNDGKLVPSSINRGVPLMMTHPQSPVGIGIKEFMGLVIGQPVIPDAAAQPAPKPGFLSRFSWQTALKAAP